MSSQFIAVNKSVMTITANGWQIAPAALEAVLMSHPCVIDAGVINIPGAGNKVDTQRAFVVRRTDAEGRCSRVTVEQLHQFVCDRLADTTILAGGICFVDHIPRTTNGDIQRHLLAQMDQYRHSVTQLLMLSTTMSYDRPQDKRTESATEKGKSNPVARKAPRIISPRIQSDDAMSVTTSSTASRTTKPRSKAKPSLADKLKALEASRLPLTDSGLR